jgi:peptidyl-prolyl cis-trans isomerase SurA
MICERRGDPADRSPDEAAIAERLEQERLDRLARRYLRDLRAQAFIEMRI